MAECIDPVDTADVTRLDWKEDCVESTGAATEFCRRQGPVTLAIAHLSGLDRVPSLVVLHDSVKGSQGRFSSATT